MTIYVALLRGVNLGSRKLTMVDLRAAGEEAGFDDVKTHLASGNLIFTVSSGKASGSASDLAAALSEVVSKKMKAAVPVVVRNASRLEQALAHARTSFPGADDKTLAIAFLNRSVSTSTPDVLGDVGDDQYRIAGSEIYLFYPNGQARSKMIPPLFDSKLKVISTVRGVNTVEGLLAKMS
jgi:uncharacterized protein (DUF1697 family)